MQEETRVSQENLRVTAFWPEGGPYVLDITPAVITGYVLKKALSVQAEYPLEQMGLVINEKHVKNYHTISEYLSEEGQSEVNCYVVLKLGQELKDDPVPLRVDTVLRCLADKPRNTCIYWMDIERDNALCFSQKAGGGEGIRHTYSNPDRFREIEDSNFLKTISSYLDDLITKEDIVKFIKVKSLFDTAMNVFTRTASLEDRQKFFSFVQRVEISPKARFHLDPYLIPNTKLDCLTIVREFIKITESKFKASFSDANFSDSEKTKYGEFKRFLESAHAVLQEMIENNRVRVMANGIQALLVTVYDKLKDEKYAGLYLKEGVSVLGVLSQIATKLEHFLSSLKDCNSEFWQIDRLSQQLPSVRR